MSSKWNMVIDVARCDNCRNCFLAAKDEHIGNDFPGYAAPQPQRRHNWIDIRRQERGLWPVLEANFMPVMCNHCDAAPCMTAARDGAVRKRDDGIVIIDPEKAVGQKQIVDACPYNAVYWNEEAQLPQTWIFDAHLLDQGWEKTRAESVCPLDVFESLKVSDEEMQALAEDRQLEVLNPEWNTKPRVYYRNLHLFNQSFVAGTVVFTANGVEECAKGAEIRLMHQGREIATVNSDLFGEFKFDRLERNSGPYQLLVKLDSFLPLSRDFDLGEDCIYLGTLPLNAAAA